MIRVSRIKLMLNDAEAELIVRAEVETWTDDTGLHVTVRVLTAEFNGVVQKSESLPELLVKVIGNAIADQVAAESQAPPPEPTYVN
jgi:hypothetical protein